MKKTLFLILCCCWALAGYSGPVSQQEALAQAKAYLQKQRAGKVTRTAPQDELTLAYECVAKSTRGVQVGNPLYYVFNRGTAGGFVVVAGDDRMQPIMACTDNGVFDKDTDNPGLKWWLEEAEYSMMDIAIAEGPVNNGLAPEIEPIAPLVTTKWNQGDPYNIKCPVDPKTKGQSLTGCAATAIAQIINYWGQKNVDASLKPIPAGKINYTTDNRKIIIDEDLSSSNFTMDWANMCDEYKGGETQAQKEAVATLMYACGISLGMDYTSGASAAAFSAQNIIAHFGMHDASLKLNRKYYSTVEWDQIMKNELLAGRPIMYEGQAAIDGGGHGFVCCGYESQGRYYINWGWGGSDDGYFLLSKLNSNINSTGGSVSGTNGGFNRYQFATVGFQPAKVPNGRAKEYPLYYDGISLVGHSLSDLTICLDGFHTSDQGVEKQTYICIGYDDKDGVYHTIHNNRGATGWGINSAWRGMTYRNMDLTGQLGDGEYTIYPTYTYEANYSENVTFYPISRHAFGFDCKPKLKIKVSNNGQHVEVVETTDHLSQVEINRIEAGGDGVAYAGHTNKINVYVDNPGEMFSGTIHVQRGEEVIAADSYFIPSRAKDFVMTFEIKAPANGVLLNGKEVDQLKFYMNGDHYGTGTDVEENKRGEFVPSTGKLIPENTSNNSCTYALIRPDLSVSAVPVGSAFSGQTNTLKVTVHNGSDIAYSRPFTLGIYKYSQGVPANGDLDLGELQVDASAGQPTSKVSIALEDESLVEGEYGVTNLYIDKVVIKEADGYAFKQHTNKLEVRVCNNGKAYSGDFGFFSSGHYISVFENSTKSIDINTPVVATYDIYTDTDNFLRLFKMTSAQGGVFLSDKTEQSTYNLVDAPILQLDEISAGVYIQPVSEAVQDCYNELLVKVSNTSKTTAYRRDLKLVRKNQNGQYVLLETKQVSLDAGAAGVDVIFNVLGPKSATDEVGLLSVNNNVIRDGLGYELMAIAGTPSLSVTFDEGFVDNEGVVYEGEEFTFSYLLKNTSPDAVYAGNLWILNYPNGASENTAAWMSNHLKVLANSSKTISFTDNFDKSVGWCTLIPYSQSGNVTGFIHAENGNPILNVMGFHRSGDFILVKNSSGYVSSVSPKSTFEAAKLQSVEGANSLYYFNDGKLLSYGCGLYLGHNVDGRLGHDQVLHNGEKLEFAASSVGGQQLLYYKDGANKHYAKVVNGVVETSDVRGEATSFTFEKVTSLPVTLRAAQEGAGAYGTLFTPVALSIPEGVKAYVGKMSTDQTQLTLKEVRNNIPANTAVLLWSPTAGVKEMPIATAVVAPIPASENDFVGQVDTRDKEPGKLYLGLGMGKTSQKIGFYQSRAPHLAGFRARLVLDEAAASLVNGFSLVFEDDELTAVENVLTEENVEKNIYDLSGRRVINPTQGIYIINGKKVYVK